jgi:hypothetical protein
VFEGKPAAGASEQAHRRPGSATALGRAAGIEDLKAVPLLVQGKVAVAEDHCVGAGEPLPKAPQPSPGGSGVVDEGEAGLAENDLEGLRQALAETRLVDVAVDGVNPRAEGLELLQNRDGGEVAGVDDGLRFGDQLFAALRQAPGSLRHVGVGDDREHAADSADSPRAPQ